MNKRCRAQTKNSWKMIRRGRWSGIKRNHNDKEKEKGSEKKKKNKDQERKMQIRPKWGQIKKSGEKWKLGRKCRHAIQMIYSTSAC